MGLNRDKKISAFPLFPAVCLGIGASPYPFMLVVCLNLKEVSVPERAGLCSPALLKGVVSSLRDKRQQHSAQPEAIADSGCQVSRVS